MDAAWPARPGALPLGAGPATAAAIGLPRGPSLSLVHRADAAQSELRIGRVAAARSTPDYAALAVMNTVLGGTFVSRMNLKLREQKGFTYGVRSTFDYRREPGPFSVQTSVQASATTEAIADILTEVRDISAARPAIGIRDCAGPGGAHAQLSAELRDGRAGGARGRADGPARAA